LVTELVRIFLVCLVAYAWVVHGWHSWNADSHLALTYAIVDRHTLDIDSYAADLGDRAMVGEHYYTDKLPAQSFLAVPAYALMRTVVPPVTMDRRGDLERAFVRYVLTLLMVSLPAALGVALLWRELVRTGAARSAASLAALGYGLGSLLWPFSTWYFSHSVAATCVLATWIWARRGESRALIPAALAVMCEAPAIVPVAPALLLGALMWWRECRPVRWWRLAGSVAVAALPVVLTALYATAVYGAPWRLGYEHLAGPEVFRTGMSAGLMGISLPRIDVLKAMLIEPYRGLLVANPVLLMGMVAAVLVVRRRLLWESAMLITFGMFLVIMSGYTFWSGGDSIGPRHIISGLPLVFLGSGRFFRGPIAHLLTLMSIVLMLLAVAAGSLFPEALANPWTQTILPAVVGQAPLDNNWIELVLNEEGMWTFLPVMCLIFFAWPIPARWMTALYVPLPGTGDITEAEIQHYAITWWKRSDRRGDRTWGSDVVRRLAIRRPGKSDAAS
jgi:hypothetical protein